jgi:drug/metabolite transporter (DMT)-like permease
VSATTTTRTTHRPKLGALLTCASMLMFACMDAMSKFLVQDYPVVEALWVRYVIFTVFAFLVARRAGIRETWHSTRPWLQAGRALLSLVENGVFVVSFVYLPLAETHAVAATSPLLVVLLSVLVLRERAGPQRWLAVAVGLAGVLLIIRPGFVALRLPLLLPLSGAFLWAVYQVMVRLLARGDRPETTLLWSAGVGLAAVSLVVPFQWHTPDARAWLLLLCIGTLGSLAHFALIKALDFSEASAVQPYGYTLLVWATVLGFLVFGNVPGPWTVAGACVVVAGGLWAWWQDVIRYRRGAIRAHPDA